MNVKQLKRIIKDLDDNTLVVMSSDSEGNHFSPLANVSSDEEGYRFYSKDREILSQHDLDEGEILPKGGKKCIIIWPT